MFNIFARKNRCLGVDISTTGVKVVELKKENNTPVFVNYAITHDPGSFLQSSDPELLDGQIIEAISSAIKAGNFGTKKAVMGIPGFFSLISFIELPEMPESEIDKAVKFEAAKYIPTPLNEVSLGWEIVGGSETKALEGGTGSGQSRKIQVMVVSVPRNITTKFEDVAKGVRLKLAAIEVENFAAVRALVGNDKGTFAIVNIGAKATDFTIVSDGVVRIVRSINIGGAEISRSLASGLGIDIVRANQLKISKRINLLDAHGEATNLIRPVVGIIIDEVKRLREIYHQKSPLRKIEKILFTGGTSKMNTLVEFFSKEMGLDCQKGNPLARVGVEKRHQPLLDEVAPELTVAVGLAMRGLGEV